MGAYLDIDDVAAQSPLAMRQLAELRGEIERLRELADSEGTRAVECLRRARKAEEERDHYLAQFLASH
jgi:prefoldin subunit 5